MNIETLYENKTFDAFINELCIKRRINEPDDFRQDVFLELIEKGESWDISDAKKIADRIAQKVKRRQIKESAYSFNEQIDSTADSVSVLWEDNHLIGVR